MEKSTRNMPFKFQPIFIPIYGYMVSNSSASVLTPETFCKRYKNEIKIHLHMSLFEHNFSPPRVKVTR